MKSYLSYCLLAVTLAFSSVTQAEGMSGAASAITRYFDAIKTYDTAIIANMMHPQALGQFRTTINKALQGEKSDLAKMELLPLFSVASIEEYMQLSDAEAYKRLNDVVAKAQPQLIDLMKSSNFEVVSESTKEDLVYITYSLTLTIEGQTISQDAVQKLKEHDGQWLLMLPSDGEATIAGIENRYN